MRAILIGLISGALLSILPAPTWAQGESDLRTIKVTGQAEVKIVPDQVVFIIGVETVDKSVSNAKKQNDKQIEDIASVAARYGVQKSDIGTDYISVNPKYEHLNDERKFVGYSVRRPVTITLNDVNKYDSLLTDLLDKGITEIQNVQFQSTDLRQYRDQARINAIKAASEKAGALANELGLKLGKARSIVEQPSTYRNWYGRWGSWYYGSGTPNPFNSSVSVESPERIDMPVALGKISVSAGVEVVFESE
jgi:uncharacterized protein YggE